MKGNQGIFHLLSIFSIPLILAVFFLWENYWLGGVLSVAFVIVIWKLIRKK